jgi:acetyl-CoA carboxylase biotin carboxyl carrier protein
MNDQNETPEGAKTDMAGEIDTKLVRKLADILKATVLSEIEVERGELRIRVARELYAAPAAQPIQYAAAPTAPAPAAAPAVPASAVPAAPERKGDLVKSPMVGTAYMQAKPGDPAFAKVGDTVHEGQTLLIIEAMKTMNPIASPRAGVVAEVLITDGQPIEFGQPLIVLE